MTSLIMAGQAFDLIESLATKCSSKFHFGTMSPAVYDTAWVAMIAKEIDGEKQWLFPECFQYLLDTQLLDGSWPSYASEVDGILNTMSALLALKRHADTSRSDSSVVDLDSRISKATASLHSMLQAWDVEHTVHVGFEVLIPSLLEQLECEKEPIHIDFPGRCVLMEMNSEKLGRFDTRFLYSKTATTLLHSLEAFVGKIEFDKVAHHRVFGSMMGSPSATAAYLMNSSNWDDESEAYLRMVITSAAGNGGGGVPSAFPSTIFEATWALSTLLLSGFTGDVLGQENVKIVADFLEKELDAGQGSLGFAPGFQADADDTSKAILCLNLLGKPALPDRMIAKFSTGNHFKTYAAERDSSFSANCNVLNMLVRVSSPNEYLQPILEAANFVGNCWSAGVIKDKWNLSEQYSMMLMAEGLVGLLNVLNSGNLSGLSSETPIIEQSPSILLQMLVRTLSNQQADGSWGEKKSPEEAAYGVLTLVTIASLPWTSTLKVQIQSSIKNGRNFLESILQAGIPEQYIWVEKVTYGSKTLTLSYCLAAMNVSKLDPGEQWGEVVHRLLATNNKAISKFSQFYSQLPLFSNEPTWKLEDLSSCDVGSDN